MVIVGRRRLDTDGSVRQKKKKMKKKKKKRKTRAHWRLRDVPIKLQIKTHILFELARDATGRRRTKEKAAGELKPPSSTPRIKSAISAGLSSLVSSPSSLSLFDSAHFVPLPSRRERRENHVISSMISQSFDSGQPRRENRVSRAPSDTLISNPLRALPSPPPPNGLLQPRHARFYSSPSLFRSLSLSLSLSCFSPSISELSIFFLLWPASLVILHELPFSGTTRSRRSFTGSCAASSLFSTPEERGERCVFVKK